MRYNLFVREFDNEDTISGLIYLLISMIFSRVKPKILKVIRPIKICLIHNKCYGLFFIETFLSIIKIFFNVYVSTNIFYVELTNIMIDR